MLALGFVCCVMLAIDWMYPKQEQTAAVDVSSHYAQTVRVEKETPLFEKKDGEYREIGRIFKGTVLKFDKIGRASCRERVLWHV